MATTKKVLVLKFGYASNADSVAQITINKPKTGLTDDVIKTAMETVVASNVLYKKDETTAIDKIVEANYVSTVTEELAI